MLQTIWIQVRPLPAPPLDNVQIEADFLGIAFLTHQNFDTILKLSVFSKLNFLFLCLSHKISQNMFTTSENTKNRFIISSVNFEVVLALELMLFHTIENCDQHFKLSKVVMNHITSKVLFFYMMVLWSLSKFFYLSAKKQ